MNIGDKVYFCILRDVNIPNDYKKIRGEIVRYYKKGRSIKADDIINMFGARVGSNKFNKFYAEKITGERVIMKDTKGEYHIITSRLWKNKLNGSDSYVDVIPNSVDFILGDDL